MKALYFASLAIAMMFVACDSGSSAESSPYGDKRYERHVPSNESAGACYVYEKGDLYSVVMEQNYGSMGSISVLSQVEIFSDRLAMHEEVSLYGLVASEAVTDYCTAERETYEQGMGGTVTCTKSKITSDAVMEFDVADTKGARKRVIDNLSESCDGFIEDLEANMASLK